MTRTINWSGNLIEAREIGRDNGQSIYGFESDGITLYMEESMLHFTDRLAEMERAARVAWEAEQRCRALGMIEDEREAVIAFYENREFGR